MTHIMCHSHTIEAALCKRICMCIEFTKTKKQNKSYSIRFEEVQKIAVKIVSISNRGACFDTNGGSGGGEVLLENRRSSVRRLLTNITMQWTHYD